MRILRAGRWIEGSPDFHRPEAEYRIEIRALLNLERLEGLYFLRARSLRTLWNYLGDVGPRAVLRKVVSRTREALRNEKLVSCGVGRILEGPENGARAPGDWVVFVAPLAPACVERLVLPGELLWRLDEPVAARHPAARAARDGELLLLPAEDRVPDDRWWAPVAAWSPYSGETLSPFAVGIALKEATRVLLGADWSWAQRLPTGGASAPDENLTPTRARKEPRKVPRKRAVLFGHGNYAKVILLPNVRRHLDVTRIHEIDPTQIPFTAPGAVTWDTSPYVRPESDFDAHLIAGYHHTHAPLACEALRKGAAAVVEKPIATTRRQLATLLEAMEAAEAPLFACFQRRYLPFNALALRDLGISRRGSKAVNYHCVVHEAPLPARHWYRWPSSRSRLVSNGCHWLDHFLWLNAFEEVTSHDLAAAPDGTLNVSVSLANGAFFSMVLTDEGADRVGMQDYTQLRCGGVTVTIENSSCYVAEDGRRILRRARANRLRAYECMYREIARRIAEGLHGDSRTSVERSTLLVLQLEESLGRLARGEMPAPLPMPAVRGRRLEAAQVPPSQPA